MTTNDALSLSAMRMQLIDGLNAASEMLAQNPQAYGVQEKVTAVQNGLDALRTIGFGENTDRLTGSGLHATVADWLGKKGINGDPLPPTPVVTRDGIDFGEGALEVSFRRTLRVADDGKTHKLPANLGAFPMEEIGPYEGKVPASWSEKGGILVPMYQREALWMLLGGGEKKGKPPIALMVASGMINAVSGAVWSEGMNTTARAQNYVVGPKPQPWLDGWNAGEDADGRDIVKQFVAMPLGMGYTVEKHITGKEQHGGVQLLARRMKPEAMVAYLESHLRGVVRDLRKPIQKFAPPVYLGRYDDLFDGLKGGGMMRGLEVLSFGTERGFEEEAAFSGAMGLGAGGKIEQQILKDPHGVSAWDQGEGATGRLWAHLVNSERWTQITGEAPPWTPVTKEEYRRRGYAWFEFYDETAPSANRRTKLADAPSLAQIDQSHGFTTDAASPTPAAKVVVLSPSDPSQVTGVKVSPTLPTPTIPGAANQGTWPKPGAGGGQKPKK